MEIFGFEPDPETQAKMREAEERSRMQWQDFSNRFTTMVTEELTYEQLRTVAGMVSLISNTAEPKALANFYEGILAGALATRSTRCGEGDETTVVDVLGSNDPRSIQ